MTPYLEYHPGGIPEIMRGAGRDGTDLFDEVRRSSSFNGSMHCFNKSGSESILNLG